jgi:hypothetical protein
MVCLESRSINFENVYDIQHFTLQVKMGGGYIEGGAGQKPMHSARLSQNYQPHTWPSVRLNSQDVEQGTVQWVRGKVKLI